jgi:hypothetical protein
MRQTNLLVAVLGLVILIGACRQDVTDPASNLSNSSMPGAVKGAVDRPIQGTCTSVYELFDFVFLPPPNEDVAVSARIHQEGTCQLTHLGRATLVDDQVIDFTMTPNPITGHVVLTAANGDELYASEISSVDPPTHDPHSQGRGTWIWTGGTGRFAGASGQAPWTSDVSLDEFLATVDMDGRISY